VTAISLVVAVAENGMIGTGGKIPWRIADDMRHFKAVTLGKPCIMGRKTWDSLPRKPLPDRTNIVVTRDLSFEAPGAAVVHSLDEAILYAGAAPEIAIIGGGEIYAAAMPRATRIHLTEVHRVFVGDARFAFDRAAWRETARENHATENGLHYSFVTLERAAAAH
jgi:dihydrofolate reductase